MLTIESIVDVVTEHFKMDNETIYKGYGYRANLAREIVILMARNVGGYSNKQVTEHFAEKRGQKDHRQTVSWGYLNIKKKLKQNKKYGPYTVRFIVANVYAKVIDALKADPDTDPEILDLHKKRIVLK